jgi:hypothetical protein
MNSYGIERIKDNDGPYDLDSRWIVECSNKTET